MAASRRILVVNANTSAAATARLAEGSRRSAGPGTEVTCVAAAAGPEGIDTPLDLALAGVEVVRVIARERDAYDAFVIACGGDPGLDAARQVTTKPVVGIGEAAMLCACPLGATFAVLTTLEGETASIRALARSYGLEDRFAGVAALGHDTASLIAADDGALLEIAQAACRRAIDVLLAEVIILGGSVMIGLEGRLSEDLGVPVLAATACGVRLAEALVGLGAHTSRAHKYAAVAKRDRLIGYEDLQDVYGAERPT